MIDFYNGYFYSGYQIEQIIPLTGYELYAVTDISNHEIGKEDDRYGFDFEAKRIYGMALIRRKEKGEIVQVLKPILNETFFCEQEYYDFAAIIPRRILENEAIYHGKVYFDDLSIKKPYDPYSEEF